LTTVETASFLAGCAAILVLARLFGHLFRSYGQPAVVGEILAGVILGPTVLGWLSPPLSSWFFPTSPPYQEAFSALATLSMCMVMVIAGMEVDLGVIRREAAKAGLIAAVGTGFLLALAFGLGFAFPAFWGSGPIPRHVFALFFAAGIAISALPVIIRILTDLRLFKTPFGMTVVTIAILIDLLGWMLFSLALALAQGSSGAGSPLFTLALTVALIAFALTAGRWLVRRAVRWVHKRLPWPGGALTFIIALGMACAAISERVGVHAVLGAFVAGILFSDPDLLEAKTREITEQFISAIFAPLFFASIGLRANFITAFRPELVLAVLALAIAGKWVGFTLAARVAGLKPPESSATAFALLARGMMGIIFGLVGFQAGFISMELFVALVIMAVVTSMMSGPLLVRALKLRSRVSLPELLDPDLFVTKVRAVSSDGAIRVLASRLARKLGCPTEAILAGGSGSGPSSGGSAGLGLAIRHATLPGLTRTWVVVGRSPRGIDFSAADGQPCHWLFLVATPEGEDLERMQLLPAIERRFAAVQFRRELETVTSFHLFLRLCETTDEA
jgi:Kef-type K+ transport system membrane component KefB/mannitol/fructose-specific phosphotransferase system IIA component (Ntr-type)